MSLVEVVDLHVTIGGKKLLCGFHFSMGREKVGLLGPSGSGKSLFSKTLVGLLPRNATVEAKKMEWKEQPLVPEKLRGKEIGLILQEAKSALHPFMTVEKQLKEAGSGVLEALDRVSLSPKALKKYPHELSGGMGQRVLIAMMLMLKPTLLIADEMLSSLDFHLKEGILDLLQEITNQEGMALLYITHDPYEVEKLCDRQVTI